MSLLKSLIESSHVPFYVDYRTGSVRSLSGLAAADVSTIVDFPRLTHTGKGQALSCRDGNLSYAHQSDQILTQATWMYLFPSIKAPATDGGRLISKRSAVGVAYDQQLKKSGLLPVTRYYTGAVVNDSDPFLTGGRTITWTHTNGSTPVPFVDGSTVTLSAGGPGDIGVAPADLLVGNYFAGGSYRMITNVLMAAIVINEALSSADIARLHRELVAGPTVVRRPSRHFSIPYPAKTPSEYAADDVTLDTDMRSLQGRSVDFTGSGRDFPTAGWGREKDGPFEGASSLPPDNFQLANPGSIFLTDDWTLEAWIKPRESAAVAFILGDDSWGWEFMEISNAFRVGSVDSGGTIRRSISPAGSKVKGKWTHVLATQTSSVGSLSNAIYVDGVAANANTWAVSRRAAAGNIRSVLSAGSIRCDVANMRHRTVALTPAEIRAEYLKGATKCLLDARVHSDGSCPVSLADVGAPNELANGWKVESGTWRVVEDAPVNGRPGKRWATQSGSSYVYLSNSDSDAFGSWHGMFNVVGTSRFLWCFVSQSPTTYGQSYAVYMTGGGELFLLKDGSTGLDSVAASPSGDVEFFVTRTGTGDVKVWAFGGAIWSDWTLILEASDNTYAQSKAQLFVPRTPAKFGGSFHLLGAMTPYEAIRAGKLEGTIPESFWTVTTTDTTQSWAFRQTAGATLVVDWGDGIIEWVTGTGGTDIIAHTYASVGTYTIKLYTNTKSDVIRIYANTNDLVGQMLSLDSFSNLDYFLGYNNASLTGSIPSLTEQTTLLRYDVRNCSLTGYEGGSIAVTCTDFNASINALSQSAIDQILIDFTTGAGARPAAGTIDLSGGTNAAPTPAVLAAAQSALPGWTISTN